MSLHEPISIHEAVVEHATTEQPVKRVRRRLGVSWATIILFAVVISYVNGFWVTSLQGAVGSLERSEPPFQRWLRDSSIMVPLYAAGVLVAVLLARRWFGRSKRAVVRAAGRRHVDHRRVHIGGHRRGRQQRGLRLPAPDRTHRTRRGLQPRPTHGDTNRLTNRRLRRDVCGQAINPRAPHPGGHPGQRAATDHQHVVGGMAPRCRR